MQGQNDAVVQALRRADLEGAPVTPQERALLELVHVLTLHPYRCQDDDVQRVRDAGWTDPQIAEGVYITALFAFFNRVADAFGLQDPHYEMFAAPPQPGPWKDDKGSGGQGDKGSG